LLTLARTAPYSEKIGVFGVVHPHVLKGFELPVPCSILEIDIEGFLAMGH
jgi:phenylalanyl-tRNA synthetase beta chain